MEQYYYNGSYRFYNDLLTKDIETLEILATNITSLSLFVWSDFVLTFFYGVIKYIVYTRDSDCKKFPEKIQSEANIYKYRLFISSFSTYVLVLFLFWIDYDYKYIKEYWKNSSKKKLIKKSLVTALFMYPLLIQSMITSYMMVTDIILSFGMVLQFGLGYSKWLPRVNEKFQLYDEGDVQLAKLTLSQKKKERDEHDRREWEKKKRAAKKLDFKMNTQEQDNDDMPSNAGSMKQVEIGWRSNKNTI